MISNILFFLKNTKEIILGIITFVIGIFLMKKYSDQKDEIIELQNENNNLKVEKHKSEIEKENLEVENVKLQDEIEIKDFENNISEPKSEKIEKEIEDFKEKISKSNNQKKVFKIEL
jgi:chromosome segregation ATPase